MEIEFLHCRVPICLIHYYYSIVSCLYIYIYIQKQSRYKNNPLPLILNQVKLGCIKYKIYMICKNKSCIDLGDVGDELN